MEVMAETPPPLPPKTKRSFGSQQEESKTVDSGNGTFISIARPCDVGPLKFVKDRRREGDGLSLIAEDKSSNSGPKVITWEATKKPEVVEDLYEIVSNGGVSYLENRLKTIANKSDAQRAEAKKKTPKIEVRQEENKTVVKISIKDTPTPEDETTGEERFGTGSVVYENGRLGVDSFGRCEGGEHENTKAYAEDERRDENPSDGCYENVDAGERFYANLSENASCHGRAPKKELLTEANYGNLNGDDSKCDQVYSNREIQVSERNVVSIISKISTPPVTCSFRRDDGDEELYENVRIDCHVYSNEHFGRNSQKYVETKEKREGERKSSVVEVFLQKPFAKSVGKVEKLEAEYADDNSSGDPFDSGTCSDVDSLPNCAQSRKVIVTIKNLNDDKGKKMETGHKRAESSTSSGLGVDSEESDDEKSNISCDSLNSNDPYPQSYSEDHGYHTPNSEGKTGSPADRMEYENVVDRRPQDKNDIIRQVNGTSQKMKSLRMGNGGVYRANPVEPSELENYENVCLFDRPPTFHKKKPPPPPLPVEAVLRDGDGKKSLPKSLLRDIRSRNVRLSSTYPSGEKRETGSLSVAKAVFELESGAPGKRQQTPPNGEKQPMVEERTYEERKTDARSVKINKICAIEVDTDKFYKFHLAENLRDNVKENVNEEETFAGVKDYLCREKPAAITSAKGTIRGVKNRVKAGIATFLQLHENKSYKERDAGKVVVYTTTMGIVRETYHKCLKVKQILRTLMVKFEERDVFMSSDAQDEIRDRMKCSAILVPQVFVEGQHVGDAETIERLNEMGELRTILKPYKSADACSTCKVCGGYRLLPCSVCKGSKKSIHRNHFTAEFVALKCMNCDQVGLTKCHAC